MKNVLLVLVGFVLAVACGSAVTDAVGQDAGLEETGTTSGLVWVTRTYECERDIITSSLGVPGFEWPELRQDQVRAVHVIRAAEGEPRQTLYLYWELYDGFLGYLRPCAANETFIVTLGLELSE